MNHAQRYQSLIAHLDAYRQHDNYYTGACYLLAYNETLCHIAAPNIGFERGAEIDFQKIIRSTKDEKLRVAAKVAYSLFNGNDRVKVNPYEIATLGCPWPELIFNTMLITDGSATVELHEDQITVNDAKYQSTKQMLRQDFGIETPTAHGGLQSICKNARTKAESQSAPKSPEERRATPCAGK